MLSRNNEVSFSIFFKYDILIYLALIITFHILHRLNKKNLRQQADRANLLTLQLSFREAKDIFSSENRRPYGKSKLGGTFGLFSPFRHNSFPTEAAKTEEKLSTCTSIDEAKDHIINLLKNEGSLWDFNKGFNHSFNNYLLTSLRYKNTSAYREIIERTYGVAFVTGKIILYRRDTRDVMTIFKEGFQLKVSCNSYWARKLNYANPATYSYGVSFSKKIPPTHYGASGFYYCIDLPENHNLLLVDIVKSPRNAGKLTQYHLNLEEVNSLDDIPAAFVRSCISQNTIGFFQTERKNENFSPTTQIRQQDRSFRGCY